MAWEVYEFEGDALFNTSRRQGERDTVNDIISDAFGALAVAAVLWFGETMRASRPEAVKADVRR